MRPVVSELLREGYKIKTKNVQSNQKLATQHDVRVVPTFIYIVEGEVKRRKSGYQSADNLRAMWRPTLW